MADTPLTKTNGEFTQKIIAPFPYEIDPKFIAKVLGDTVRKPEDYAVKSALRIEPRQGCFAGIEAQVNIPDLGIFKQDKPAHVHEQYVTFVQALSALLLHTENNNELFLPSGIFTGYTLLIDEWRFKETIEQRDACIRIDISEPKLFSSKSYLFSGYFQFMSTDKTKLYSKGKTNVDLVLR